MSACPLDSRLQGKTPQPAGASTRNLVCNSFRSPVAVTLHKAESWTSSRLDPTACQASGREEGFTAPAHAADFQVPKEIDMDSNDGSDGTPTRRQMVRAGVVAGSALLAAGGAAVGQEQQARQASATGEPEGATGLTDPQNKYPKPPFAKQQQPWPGLASKMNPRPDHGETSYKGTGRLAGRKALITGGDSGIGR